MELTAYPHLHTRAAALLTLAVFTPFNQAYQLFDVAPTSLPTICGNALAANISCNQLFSASYIAGGGYVSVAALDDVCSADCKDSLLSFQANVDDACGNTTYLFPGNVSQTVQNFVEPLVWALEAACITSDSTYCLPAVIAGNVSDCSPCMYKYEAAMLDSPYGQVRYSPDTYSSLLSSCGVAASSYPITDTAVATVLPSVTATTVSATATATCSSYYSVKSGDTCQSIATANSISTARFIIDNNLSTLNCSVQVGQQVCLGAECALHEVQANDTCSSILQNQAFYQVQLTSWNPTLWTDCGNLDRMPPGNVKLERSEHEHHDKLERVGGNSLAAASIESSDSPFDPALLRLSLKILGHTPYGLHYAARPAIDVPRIQYVGNRMASHHHHPDGLQHDYSNGWTIYDLPESCESLLDEYCDPAANATMPASTVLPATCSPAYYMSSNTTATTASTASTASASSTSVSRAPEQTGIAANCDAYYVVKSGDSCAGIVAEFGNFTLAQFYSWNPAVGSTCSYLDIGDAVCIGTASSTSASSATSTATATTASSTLEPNTDPSCTKYHKVVAGDSCVDIEQEYGITAAEFLAWNPTVGSSCSGLWLGYLVCVDAPAIASSSTTPTATSTSTSTSAVPDVEPSTVADCTKYHLVVSGDDCQTIEAQYGITAAQFNEWNPYVGAGCESLY
ncbi:hypothetical protein MPDQ_004049 [Monascus purpureus]|uniref:LysM domain-containing protein n=1 Tax=Monascus purpureus TaxID=5098 RepID=A0A507QLL8_MONPU|nr:hypothetical protein MPDQ_004049 [Monascus purpureus]